MQLFTISRLATATALVLGCGGVQAAFVNGSFEIGPDAGSFITLATGSTAISGWNVTEGSIDYVGSYWNAQDGDRSLDLAGNGSPSTISQTFATNPGWQYTVTFWMAGNPDGPPPEKPIEVSADNYSSSFGFAPVGTRNNMGWVERTFSFHADDELTTLSFRSNPQTGPYGAALDNVSIVGVVPEPHEWAMLLAGLGIVATAARRRRSAPQATPS